MDRSRLGGLFVFVELKKYKIMKNLMKDRKIIKIEIPKVIWDAEMSIFNFRPILKTWMDSVQDAVNKTSEIYSKQK